MQQTQRWCTLKPAGRLHHLSTAMQEAAARHAAAAYVTPHGFKWWKCTGKLKKAHINLLEMQAVLEYYQDNAAYVEGRIVPYYGDNTTVIRCLRRGRSKSRKLNEMCQEILLICYEHDIWPEWHWVASKENILADAASRQQWQIFWENWGAYPGFAGYRRARNLQEEAKEEGSRLKVLHPRARQAVGHPQVRLQAGDGGGE